MKRKSKKQKRKSKKKIFFAWLRNGTDIRDDEPIKIGANSKEEATEIARHYLGGRFYIRGVYTCKEFKELEPWWYSMMSKWKAKNE